MLRRRASWAQFIRAGLPILFVLRPLAGYTPDAIGDVYPVTDETDKVEMMHARQMYEQRRIGSEGELDIVVSKIR